MNGVRPRLIVAVVLATGLGACGSSVKRVSVNVPSAPNITSDLAMAQEVGRLLSSDAAASEAAERRLLAQTDEGRDALLEFATTIPDERDLRWLNVLDEHHALPELEPEEELTFLIWKAREGDRFHVMKVQSRLIDIAQTDPERLTARLERGEQGNELLIMALGLADARSSVPVLLERYLEPASPGERQAAVEALSLIVDTKLRPRTRGTEAELRQDAARVRRWYRHEQELAAEQASKGEVDG